MSSADRRRSSVAANANPAISAMEGIEQSTRPTISTIPSLSSSPVNESPRSDTPADASTITATAIAFDLRSLDYVAEVDDNLICPICRCPFVNPLRLSCDHIFCQECVDTALANQASESRTCPSCRSPVLSRSGQPVPRALRHMVDELLVRCPHEEDGCTKITSRSEMQHHVEKYCDYTEVDCPAEECRQQVQRRNLGRGCLHSTIPCNDCGADVMERDIEKHREQTCRRKTATCPDCSLEFSHQELKAHRPECPEAIIPCSGSPYGCTYVSKRAALQPHVSSCPIASMAPFLKSQNDRIDAQHSMIKNLQRRNDILEGGLTSIQAMLCTSTFDSVGVDSTTLLASASSPLSPPPASSSATAGSASTSTLTSVPNQPNPDPADLPPFNSAIHHLLSLHESLRQEVDRVSAAVSELDARSSMMIMNESLRNKEDITHTNAALNSMRMQLHWLLSARLQMQSRMAAAAAAAANSPAGSTAATSPPNRSRDMGVGTSGAAVASAFGLPPPLRRMSDGSRQDTKL